MDAHTITSGLEQFAREIAGDSPIDAMCSRADAALTLAWGLHELTGSATVRVALESCAADAVEVQRAAGRDLDGMHEWDCSSVEGVWSLIVDAWHAAPGES